MYLSVFPLVSAFGEIGAALGTCLTMKWKYHLNELVLSSKIKIGYVLFLETDIYVDAMCGSCCLIIFRTFKNSSR